MDSTENVKFSLLEVSFFSKVALKWIQTKIYLICTYFHDVSKYVGNVVCVFSSTCRNEQYLLEVTVKQLNGIVNMIQLN